MCDVLIAIDIKFGKVMFILHEDKVLGYRKSAIGCMVFMLTVIQHKCAMYYKTGRSIVTKIGIVMQLATLFYLIHTKT